MKHYTRANSRFGISSYDRLFKIYEELEIIVAEFEEYIYDEGDMDLDPYCDQLRDMVKGIRRHLR